MVRVVVWSYDEYHEFEHGWFVYDAEGEGFLTQQGGAPRTVKNENTSNISVQSD